MKLFAYAVALAGLAAAAPMNAQILGSRIPTTSRSTNDGQWYSVGRDNSGNTIYERQTYDANGNTVIQRGRRNSNGSFTILSSRTVANNGNRNNDCNYTQTTNSVGDIIFGRSSANVNNCDDRNSRIDGGWYQVGRDGSGSRVYERRTTDGNGNVIIQHARRNSNGSFTILNTRTVRRNNNGTWNNNNNRGDRDDDSWDRGNRNGRSDKEWDKEQKRREKEWKKNHKGNKHDRDD